MNCNFAEVQRSEALSMRLELSDRIMLLNREGMELFEMSSLENDYVVLSSREDSYPTKGLTRVSDKIENMCMNELVAALGVSDRYFKEVEEELAAFGITEG